MNAVILMSTAGSLQEGNRIAQALVEEKLAACVNLLPGITSFFYWEGKLNREKEVLLLIKTIGRNKSKIIGKIRELHSYSLPEILLVRVGGGEPGYLNWLGRACVNRKIISNKDKRKKKN